VAIRVGLCGAVSARRPNENFVLLVSAFLQRAVQKWCRELEEVV